MSSVNHAGSRSRISRRPSAPSIPPVPASRLLSHPSTRPGRHFRSSPIDPFPSTSYGDPITHKSDGSLRLLFQNVHGLTHSTTLEDYRYYHQCLQALSVDVVGLAETNTCWSHHHLSADFRQATHRFYRQSKICFGAVSPSVDPCSQTETFQSGGNVTAVLGSLSSRVSGPNITDATGLGRWSGITLEGRNAQKLSIITAYRVCKGSPQRAPLGSSFLREYEYFRGIQHTSVNPRRQFFVDLQQTILSLQESGHGVLLMLDANSTIDERDFSVFVASCGFHDLHSLDSPPSTYIGSADRRIDFIFGCDEALQHVIRSGTLAYTEGPQSDHRSLYVDISPEFTVKPLWSQTTPSQARDLHTGNPELVSKYNASMLKYYDQHRMVERIEALFNQRETMSREELRDALIKWDNDQGRAMELSERLLRRPKNKCSWSPILRNSAIIRRYWLLRLRELVQGADYHTTFVRWEQQIQCHDPQFALPLLGTRLSTDQVRQELSKASNSFRKLQQQSGPLRLKCYEDLLEVYQDDTNPATKAESRRKAKVVMNTISGETTRRVFNNIRRIVKPSETSSLSKVLIPPASLSSESDEYSSYNILQTNDPSNILWETVVSRDELERHILQYNRDSFRAASESPCGHGVLHDALTFTSLSPESESILSGMLPAHLHDNDNYLREFLASFAIPLNVKTHGAIPTDISTEDVLRGFKGWKEQTTTSPSGRHLGHYKSLIQDPTLLKCFIYFMNIVVSRGIAIPRWCNATNVMLEKDIGQPYIHRLRIIHLFEADYNFFLKLQWGHRLVRHACDLDLLHDSQHGSIPRRTAMDPIMLTQLTTDLCRILKHDLARFDNDASACYDRIIVALGMLAARRCGMPANAIRLHADALQFMRYTVKTVYGVSESNYHGTPFAPLFGTGQGSGASPAVWLSLVVLLLHTFDRIVPHRMNFSPIACGRTHARSSDAFVDDTSVGFTSCKDDLSYTDLISRLETVAQTWEKLLHLSGGKLNLKKCSYFVLRWEWQQGRPILRKILPSDPSVSLTQGQSTTRYAIRQTSPNESNRMLGVMLNPLGDFTDHLKMLRDKADTFARRLRSPRLTETDISVFHRSIYTPSMRYSLAAVATNEEELSQVQSQISRVILQRLHIRSTIPTALRYGPIELGGLGLYDLRTEMGIEMLKYLRNALYSDSEAGNLIRLNLDYSQREAGVDFHLLEKPQLYLSYLTPSWILSVRQFLGNNNMHLCISDLHLDPLKGSTDEYIMQSTHLQRYSPAEQRDLNLVRMWLQVTTLADMSDPSRPNGILLCYLDAKRPPAFLPSHLWPRQANPTKSQQRLWKRFIRSSYLRYTPYWKVSPSISPLPVPSPLPAPTSFPNIKSYISSLTSKTERRLLDGLAQQATDLQVWSAFRSRSRLHLASDGGLSNTSATHGWVLSTGSQVLFQCSGPVDGPMDTNSSTRSELGGCASALLLLSAFTKLWGLKHRCSFNWYSDSKSAISRFHKFCGRRRSLRMPPDSDLLSIISTSLKALRRSFRPIWIKAHQDDQCSYERLPLAARLNIDADFLATRYREHGRLRCISIVDHRAENVSTLYLNGSPLTSQYDECVRFHINGYHQRAVIQKTEKWSDAAWDSVDFFTFGKHFRRLRPSLRVQHFKFVHELLPLGIQRFREASIKDDALKLCPCCKAVDETQHHLLRCTSNPALVSSLAHLRTDIINSDTHPVRYLLAEGVCHAVSSDLPFDPPTHQYPTHFLALIASALTSQCLIGWDSAIKGYFAREWADMAQWDMHKPTRDVRKGEVRMKHIISSLGQHVRRIWIARNGCLHDSADSDASKLSSEAVEIEYYHSRPHLLRLGDQHYCQRSLVKLLSSSSSTRRRWLRKVRQSSAELTKDGTQQALITSFFRSA